MEQVYAHIHLASVRHHCIVCGSSVDLEFGARLVSRCYFSVSLNDKILSIGVTFYVQLYVCSVNGSDAISAKLTWIDEASRQHLHQSGLWRRWPS